MKRFFLFLFDILLSITVFAYDFEVDGIYYNILDSNNEVEVTNNYYNTYGTRWGGSAIIIPETVEYMKRKFTVTAIGEQAFMCVNGVHLYCGGVNLPKTIKHIGAQAFYSFGLSDIALPDGLETIGDQAFVATQLSSIRIPSSVNHIGIGSFRGIVSLTNILVDEGNTHYDSRNSCNAIIETGTNTLIAGCANTIIPSNIAHIADWAFNYSQFENISLPNGLESIGAWCFANCDKLKQLDIPITVSSIGENAFFACKVIESINLPERTTTLKDGTFEFCAQLKSIDIPNTVQEIGKVCFDGCSSLQEIVIPAGVEIIGERAFNECTNLTEIKVCNPRPCTIYESTFMDLCYRLSTLYVPTGSISEYKNANFWNKFIYVEEYNPSGINLVNIESNVNNTFYDLNGRLLLKPKKGLIFIREDNGKSKKFFVK